MKFNPHCLLKRQKINESVFEWEKVAVIGKIQEIQSVTTVLYDLENVVRIGTGNCLAMEHVGFVNLNP